MPENSSSTTRVLGYAQQEAQRLCVRFFVNIDFLHNVWQYNF